MEAAVRGPPRTRVGVWSKDPCASAWLSRTLPGCAQPWRGRSLGNARLVTRLTPPRRPGPRGSVPSPQPRPRTPPLPRLPGPTAGTGPGPGPGQDAGRFLAQRSGRRLDPLPGPAGPSIPGPAGTRPALPSTGLSRNRGRGGGSRGCRREESRGLWGRSFARAGRWSPDPCEAAALGLGAGRRRGSARPSGDGKGGERGGSRRAQPPPFPAPPSSLHPVLLPTHPCLPQQSPSIPLSQHVSLSTPACTVPTSVLTSPPSCPPLHPPPHSYPLHILIFIPVPGGCP